LWADLSLPTSSRNPLKTGLVPASRKFPSRERSNPSRRRNPLKTGLVPASRILDAKDQDALSQESQSPENGSRPCKQDLGREGPGRPLSRVAIP